MFFYHCNSTKGFLTYRMLDAGVWPKLKGSGTGLTAGADGAADPAQTSLVPPNPPSNIPKGKPTTDAHTLKAINQSSARVSRCRTMKIPAVTLTLT